MLHRFLFTCTEIRTILPCKCKQSQPDILFEANEMEMYWVFKFKIDLQFSHFTEQQHACRDKNIIISINEKGYVFHLEIKSNCTWLSLLCCFRWEPFYRMAPNSFQKSFLSCKLCIRICICNNVSAAFAPTMTWRRPNAAMNGYGTRSLPLCHIGDVVH